MMAARLGAWQARSRAFLVGLSPQGAFVLVMLVGATLALLWSVLASLDVIVRTEGRVIPAGRSQIIQHLEGGIVRAVLVQEGQAVQAGQTLIELSDIQARSNVGQDQTRLAAQRGREARLLAELNGLENIVFPADLNDPDVLRAESDAWRARRARLTEEARVLRNQAAQKRGEIDESVSRRKNLLAEREVALEQLRMVEGLKRKGAASEMEVLDSRSRMQRLDSQIAETEAAIPRLRAAQAEADSRVAEVLARFRADASSELTQVRADLEKSGLELGASADRLERNKVRAPMSGFVNRLTVTTVGGVVRPGEVLMEITPDDQRVVIETRARPNDRANLHRGLPARVRIGAYDYATFGALDGEVTEVSADTLVDDKEGRYYRVRIEAASTPGSRQPGAVLPGMTATGDVVVGKRTVMSYLLSPLLKFRDTAFRDPR